MVSEPVADIILDPTVRTLIALGATAAMIQLAAAFGITVAEPRRHLVRCAIEETTLLVAATIRIATILGSKIAAVDVPVRSLVAAATETAPVIRLRAVIGGPVILAAVLPVLVAAETAVLTPLAPEPITIPFAALVPAAIQVVSVLYLPLPTVARPVVAVAATVIAIIGPVPIGVEPTAAGGAVGTTDLVDTVPIIVVRPSRSRSCSQRSWLP